MTNGDELLVFQGSRAEPRFICAASIVSTALVASGWVTGVVLNGTDGSGAGSALPPGLQDDVNAFSFNKAATTNDNCSYSGETSAANKSTWKTRVSTLTSWTYNDAIPIPTPLVGPFSVTDPLPVELSSFTASTINGKVTLNWKTETEVNNNGFEIERTITNTNKWIKSPFC